MVLSSRREILPAQLSFTNVEIELVWFVDFQALIGGALELNSKVVTRIVLCYFCHDLGYLIINVLFNLDLCVNVDLDFLVHLV